MQRASVDGTSGDKTASAARFIFIVLEQDAVTERVQDISQTEVFLCHLLMRMCGDSEGSAIDQLPYSVERFVFH